MLRVVNSGTTKFSVDAEGDVDCGDITCHNLAYTSIGGGAANDIIDWSAIVADEISITSTVDSITLNAEEHVTLNAEGNLNFSAGNYADFAADFIDLKAEQFGWFWGKQKLYLWQGPAADHRVDFTDDGIAADVADDLFIIKGNHTSENVSHACLMMNTDTSDQSDVLKLLIGRTSDLEATNCFVRFSNGATTTGRTDGNQCGRIRGTGVATDVAYASGALDYGEWFEVGDPSEWVSAEELEEKRKANKFYFGIEEGTIVYIRARKLYKSSPGIPMAVTNRSCVVGNEREENEKNENWFGEILSFVGQLPIKLQGAASSGDYLIDSGSGYCTAVSEEDITFNQYIKAIGRALEDSEEGLDRIWCAINYK